MSAQKIQIVSIAASQGGSLTLHGLAAIKETDLIVYDDTLSPGIRDLALRSARTIKVSASGHSTAPEIEEDLQVITETLDLGQRVTRLVAEFPYSLTRLDHELRLLKLWGYGYRIIPNRETFEREAWQLQLPWLISLRPTRFRVIESAAIKGDQSFWEDLATTTDTLAIEPGRGSLQSFVEQLLMAGSDPLRPVALVSHSPQDPICWLTTLDELDELYLQWKTPAATILYIGTWPRATVQAQQQQQHDFWGPLAGAAELWLRKGILAY